MPLEIKDINAQTEDVVAAVLKEIKTLGENTKTSYNELRKNHEELKAIVNKASLDSQDVSKANKLAADISVRQEAIDKRTAENETKLNKRIDELEVIMQRPRAGMQAETKELQKEVDLFNLAQKSIKVGTSKQLETHDLTVDEYALYCKTLKKYLQKHDDARLSIFTPEEVKTLSAGIDPDGGYLVTPAMSNQIITRIYEGDVIRQLASIETLTTGSIEWLVDANECDADWETETALIAVQATADWKKKKIDVHTMSTRQHATQQLVEDAGINIESWLSKKSGDKFARTEGASFVTGDGVGKPRGFLTYTSGTTWGTIQQVSMGLASTLTADGFRKVKYALKENFLEGGNLTWVMQRSTVLAAMLLKNGAADWIWKPSMAVGGPSTIDGDPVRMSATMPTVATNSLSVAIADWRQAYMIVDRLGISIQRDPFTQKPFIEFYIRSRVGADVINYDAIKIGKVAA